MWEDKTIEKAEFRKGLKKLLVIPRDKIGSDHFFTCSVIACEEETQKMLNTSIFF